MVSPRSIFLLASNVGVVWGWLSRSNSAVNNVVSMFLLGRVRPSLTLKKVCSGRR